MLEDMQERLDRRPESMRVRRRTVEHPFGTLKFWMGATHFLCRTLPRVSTEMSLHVLAYQPEAGDADYRHRRNAAGSDTMSPRHLEIEPLDRP